MIELLDDPAYRHVLFNHVPIIGLIMAFVVLLIGLVLRQTAVLSVGLVLVVLTAGSSYPVGLFGDGAYPAVFDRLDGDGRAWLDYHTYLADTWLPVLYLNALLAAAALVLGLLRRPLLYPAAVLVVLLTIAGIITAGWIGYAGGKVKHPEFRLDDPPVIKTPGRQV
jgi:hypothetical protein